MTYTIAVTDYDYPNLQIERRVLEGHDVRLVTGQAETVDEVIDVADGADAILTQYAPVDEQALEALDVSVVGRYGIGVDNVDVDAATDRDVVVVNAPSYCEDEVASHAIALTFACARSISRYDSAITSGTWDWTTGAPIERLRGKTLGFVGFGKIPETIARRLSGFDLSLLAYDPYRSDEQLAEHGIRKVSFNELLASSEIVSIHAPLTDETRGLFDGAAFKTMNENAILINTARGSIVDTDALTCALTDGELACAGLDVLPEEPPGDSPLVGRDDVVLTPHAAWYSEDSLAELRETVPRDVLRVLEGDAPENPVNPSAVDQ